MVCGAYESVSRTRATTHTNATGPQCRVSSVVAAWGVLRHRVVQHAVPDPGRAAATSTGHLGSRVPAAAIGRHPFCNPSSCSSFKRAVCGVRCAAHLRPAWVHVPVCSPLHLLLARADPMHDTVLTLCCYLLHVSYVRHSTCCTGWFKPWSSAPAFASTPSTSPHTWHSSTR